MIEVRTIFRGSALGVLDVGFGDVFVFEHLGQDAVARLIAALGMAVGGGVVVGSANDAGEIGVFGERKLAQIFAEVGDAGFGEAANAEAAAIAEIDLVGVELENLLLVEALLELHARPSIRRACGARCARWRRKMCARPAW